MTSAALDWLRTAIRRRMTFAMTIAVVACSCGMPTENGLTCTSYKKSPWGSSCRLDGCSLAYQVLGVDSGPFRDLVEQLDPIVGKGWVVDRLLDPAEIDRWFGATLRAQDELKGGWRRVWRVAEVGDSVTASGVASLLRRDSWNYPWPVELGDEEAGMRVAEALSQGGLIVGFTPLIVCETGRHACIGVYSSSTVTLVWCTIKGDQARVVRRDVLFDFQFTSAVDAQLGANQQYPAAVTLGAGRSAVGAIEARCQVRGSARTCDLESEWFLPQFAARWIVSDRDYMRPPQGWSTHFGACAGSRRGSRTQLTSNSP